MRQAVGARMPLPALSFCTCRRHLPALLAPSTLSVLQPHPRPLAGLGTLPKSLAFYPRSWRAFAASCQRAFLIHIDTCAASDARLWSRPSPAHLPPVHLQFFKLAPFAPLRKAAPCHISFDSHVSFALCNRNALERRFGCNVAAGPMQPGTLHSSSSEPAALQGTLPARLAASLSKATAAGFARAACCAAPSR